MFINGKIYINKWFISQLPPILGQWLQLIFVIILLGEMAGEYAPNADYYLVRLIKDLFKIVPKFEAVFDMFKHDIISA